MAGNEPGVTHLEEAMETPAQAGILLEEFGDTESRGDGGFRVMESFRAEIEPSQGW